MLIDSNKLEEVLMKMEGSYTANNQHARAEVIVEVRKQLRDLVSQPTERWVVNCKVSGGVTGTRQSILKDEEGNIRYFDSQLAAHAVAEELQTKQNSDANRTAFYQYWAARG